MNDEGARQSPHAHNLNLARATVPRAPSARPAPTLAISVGLEGRIALCFDAETGEDQERLVDWLRGSPRMSALVDHVLELVGEDDRQCRCSRLPELEEQFGGEQAGTVLTFGRYEGRTISEIAVLDPVYLRWLASPAIKEEKIRAAAQAFLGKRSAA